MDPALPLYTFGNPGGRLELNDAQYVEIIHTNGGKLGKIMKTEISDFILQLN